MYQQIFNQETFGDTRLTDEDVHAAIDLWVERQWGSVRASMADVAEGLDISIEEVHALLEDVHARRRQVEISIFEERERLAIEQRELAAEQARLRMTERRLSNCRAECSESHDKRGSHRRRRQSLEMDGSASPLLKPLLFVFWGLIALVILGNTVIYLGH